MKRLEASRLNTCRFALTSLPLTCATINCLMCQLLCHVSVIQSAYALCLMSHVLCLKKHSMLHLSRVRTPCPANLCLCLCLMPYALKTLHDSPESRANTVPCQRSCKVSLFALPCMSSGLAVVWLKGSKQSGLLVLCLKASY